MEFTFKAKVGSPFSNEIIELTGNYCGPDEIKFECEGVEIILNKNNPDHIIIMDVIDNSSWCKVDENKINVEVVNEDLNIKRNIYNLNSPADNYDINTVKLIDGKLTIDFDPVFETVENRISELNRLMNKYDEIQSKTAISTRKQKLIDAINKIDWILNSLPENIDIREIVIPRIDLDN